MYSSAKKICIASAVCPTLGLAQGWVRTINCPALREQTVPWKRDIKWTVAQINVNWNYHKCQEGEVDGMMRIGQEIREDFPRMQWLSWEREELEEFFLGPPRIPKSSKPTPAFRVQLWPGESWENGAAWNWDPRREPRPTRVSWLDIHTLAS